MYAVQSKTHSEEAWNRDNYFLPKIKGTKPCAIFPRNVRTAMHPHDTFPALSPPEFQFIASFALSRIQWCVYFVGLLGFRVCGCGCRVELVQMGDDALTAVPPPEQVSVEKFSGLRLRERKVNDELMGYSMQGRTHFTLQNLDKVRFWVSFGCL